MGVCRLDELKEGEYGRIIRIENSGAIRRRLQDIGVVSGALIGCIQKSPLGDPTAYAICGAVIALRCEEASKIFVVKGAEYGTY